MTITLTADDEYTPEQRKIVDAQLDEAEKSPLHGPFRAGKQIAAYLKTFKAQGAGQAYSNSVEQKELEPAT